MKDSDRPSELSSRLIDRFTAPHRDIISRSQVEPAQLALREALSQSRSKHRVKLWRVAIERLEELSQASTLRVMLEEVRTAKNVRAVTLSTMQKAWTRGVCYSLIDCPEATGYSTLISKLSYLPASELESLIPRLDARGMLTSLVRGLDARGWTADCYDLAMNADISGLRSISDALSRRSGDQYLEVKLLIQSALWLSALISPQDRSAHEHASASPPSSLITLEVLTCNWLRGVRRSASRSNGQEMSQLIQAGGDLILPRCLGFPRSGDGDGELREKVNESLAPLRLEWLSACIYGLTTHRPSEALRELLGGLRWSELKSALAQTLPEARSDLHAWLESIMPARLSSDATR